MKRFSLRVFLLVWATAGFAADFTPSVTNEATPSGTRYTLVLEENLRIGPKQDLFWPMAGTAVQADDRGFMYVTCPTENSITVLNAKGEVVRHLGGPGQGPSEYRGLISFQILADGRGVAFETQGVASNLSWYNGELDFVEKAKLGTSPGRMYQTANLSPNGQLLSTQIVSMNQTAGRMTIGWMIMDRESKSKIKIAKFHNPMPGPEIVKSTHNFARFMSQVMTAESKGLVGFGVFDRDNHFYTAVAHKYEITRWDPDMKKQMIFSRKYKPIALTEADVEAVINPIVEALEAKMPPQMSHLFAPSTIRKAVEMAEFPPVRHPINGLFVLDDGMLGVLHNLDLVHEKMTVDLFDKKGRYLGDFTHTAPGLNSWALVFKNGYLYRIEADADKENELVRYSYKLVPTNKTF